MKDIQLIGFRVDQKEYALCVSEIHEIIRVPHITRVPLSHSCIAGVINLRGMVIPVMDLSLRLGLSPVQRTEDTSIVVTVWNGESAGLLVDSVSEIIKIRESEIQPPLSATEAGAGLFAGIGKSSGRVFFILNIDGVFRIEPSVEVM